MADATVSWLKQHERIVCLALVLLFGGYTAERYFDYDAAKTKVELVAAQQQMATDRSNSLAQAAQTAQAMTVLQNEVQADHALISSLAASVAARNTGLAAQTKTDAGLSPSALADRWNVLLGTTVQADSKGDSIVSSTDSIKTVEQLEQVPVLQANLKDETTMEQAQEKMVADSHTVIAAQSTQIVDLNKQITDGAAECKIEVAAVKADAHKKEVRVGKWASIFGFIGGVIVRSKF